MSETDTPKKIIERAKAHAERKAIEGSVGVFIRSQILVSNSPLAENIWFMPR